MQVNPQVSKAKNLVQKNKSGAGELVVVEGLHAIKHALRFKARPEVIITKNKAKLLKLANKLCPDVAEQLEELAEEVGEQFDQISDSIIRTEILGLFHKPEHSVIPVKTGIHATQRDPIVLLDNPRDLDNIGATVRVCAAADVSALIITGDSNPWNSRTIRAAAGLQFALSIVTAKSSAIPEQFQILPLISFDERGEVLDSELKTQIPKQAIYIFGSERDGISKDLKEASDLIVRLPMRVEVSSLNLATSVAAALYSLK